MLQQIICQVCGAQIGDEDICPKCGEAIVRNEGLLNDMPKSMDEKIDEESSEKDIVAEDVIQEKLEENEENQESIVGDYSKTESSSLDNIQVTKEEILQAQNKGFERILSAFEHKIAYDVTKQGQIDHLHSELQEYKRDLIAKTNRPLVNGMIKMFDDTGKLAEALRKKTEEELSIERMFSELEGVKEDIELLLEQNGVVSFSEENEEFIPSRQQVIRKIPTGNKKIAGKVAERIRPGFEQGSDLIKKERVAVYVYNESLDANQEETDTEEIAEQTENLAQGKEDEQ